MYDVLKLNLYHIFFCWYVTGLWVTVTDLVSMEEKPGGHSLLREVPSVATAEGGLFEEWDGWGHELQVCELLSEGAGVSLSFPPHIWCLVH